MKVYFTLMTYCEDDRWKWRVVFTVNVGQHLGKVALSSSDVNHPATSKRSEFRISRNQRLE